MLRVGISLFVDSFPRPASRIHATLLKSSNLHPTRLRPFACSSQHHRCANLKKSSPIFETTHLTNIHSPRLVCSSLSFCRDFHMMNDSSRVSKQYSSLPTEIDKNDLNQPSGLRFFSNDVKNEENTKNQTPDPKDKKGRFKALIRDYGVTAVVFHVTISLASLGICWLLVNSSLPMEKIFIWLGIDKKLGNLTDAASTSTNFVVAYAVHKSLALVRLSITAACVPVVVRYLRSKGILKPIANAVKK